MADEPFVSFVVVEQLGTSHEEDPPTLQASLRLTSRKILIEAIEDACTIAIEILQPGFARSPIVQAANAPLPLDRQIVAKVTEQVL